MGHRAWKRNYDEEDASLLRVWRLTTKPGERRAFVERLIERQLGGVGNRQIVYAIDADTDDGLFLMEYWHTTWEYGNGTHVEIDSYRDDIHKAFVVDKAIVFEADPVYVEPSDFLWGRKEPGGVQTTLDLTS